MNPGNVLTQREEFNAATLTYDRFSPVTSVTNPRNHTTTMEYDSRGLVIRMVSPNNRVTTYTYNAQGLMATKTETPRPGSLGYVHVWTYASPHRTTRTGGYPGRL